MYKHLYIFVGSGQSFYDLYVCLNTGHLYSSKDVYYFGLAIPLI